MRRLSLLALVLSGCDPTWPDTAWGITELSADGDEEFQSLVSLGVERWNSAMYDRCGTVFTLLESGGHPVREYAVEDWTCTDCAGNLGVFFPDHIGIREHAPEVQSAAIVHELGHALGLQHIEFEDDPDTVMFRLIITGRIDPSAGDVERAAGKLGCL